METKYWSVTLALIIFFMPIIFAVIILLKKRNKDKVLKLMYEPRHLQNFKDSPIGRRTLLEVVISICLVVLFSVLTIFFASPLCGALISGVSLYLLVRLFRLPLPYFKLMILSLLPLGLSATMLLFSSPIIFSGTFLSAIVALFFVGFLYHARLYLFVADEESGNLNKL